MRKRNVNGATTLNFKAFEEESAATLKNCYISKNASAYSKKMQLLYLIEEFARIPDRTSRNKFLFRLQSVTEVHKIYVTAENRIYGNL